ncbi:F420-dependent glucose-6-phosphate dehydrogenase [Candidatus Entotheonellaceae bacterium PAL068K]
MGEGDRLMKIRIGVGFSGWPFERSKDFWDFVDLVEESGLDSIWLNDRIRNPTPALEPIAALAMIAGRTQHIKFGMSVAVLPVRDPLVLAKEIATIDFLSDGRMLPAFGLGLAKEADWLAVGKTPQHRGAMTDEAIQLMRRLWSEDAVTHSGTFYASHEFTIQPKPVQQPIPVWFGGRSPAAYRRVARLGDGFLGAYQPPSEAAKAVGAIRQAAIEYERIVPEDHYGTIVPFHFGDADVGPEIQTLVQRINPQVPFESYAAWRTPDAVLRRLDEFVAAGITKFVLRPMVAGAALYEQFERLAEVVVPRYHI